jgi:hypothetical protein
MDNKKLISMIEEVNEITALPPHAINAIITRIKQQGKGLEKATLGELIEFLQPHLSK